MIERPIPQDVLKFKTKFVAGLTMRQCMTLLICGALAILGYTGLFSDIEAQKVRIICTALLILPVAIVGFVEIMGQPFEVTAKDMLIDNFIAPATRKKEYRHPELEKYEKDLTGKHLQTSNLEELETPENNTKKKTKKKEKTIKIKKSQNYPGIR